MVVVMHFLGYILAASCRAIIQLQPEGVFAWNTEKFAPQDGDTSMYSGTARQEPLNSSMWCVLWQ